MIERDHLKEVAWRARDTHIFGRRVAVASPEDLLILKCSAWREKDIPDARGLLRRHQRKLDLDYIRKWLQWFVAQNPYFQEMPRRLEALLDGTPLPPPVPE